MKIKIMLYSILFLGAKISLYSMNAGSDVPAQGEVSEQRGISGRRVMQLCGAALMAKMGYDISWHKSYAVQAHALYKQIDQKLDLYDLEFLYDQKMCDDVVQLEYNLWNSYSSWLTPWNWTPSQLKAYNCAQALSIIILYGPFVNGLENVDGAAVVSRARLCCSSVSMYPLWYYGQALDRHLLFLERVADSLPEGALKYMALSTQYQLRDIISVLRQDTEYTKEVQTRYTHILLQSIKLSSRNILK